MSTNRSVQAAQRRRAGNIVNDQPQRKQTPTPSINSAQMFASQVRNGNGPNIPNGRLAGQQSAYIQNEMMKQQYNDSKNSSGIKNINKMTLAQAITLITLRLGKVETLLQNGNNNIANDLNNETLFEKELIHSIMERLDSLEENINNGNHNSDNTLNTDNTQVINIQQNIDKNIIPLITQTKNTVTSLLKINNNLKIEIDELKAELEQTKSMVFEMQNVLNNNVNDEENYDENDEVNDNNDEVENIGDLDIKNLIGNEISIDM
jgi:hypothetical protein